MPTGIAMAVPEGYVALVHPRSGLAARHGLSIVNTPGTIDAGYRGEVKVLLVNLDPAEPIELRRGDRVAQLVLQRVEQAAFTEVEVLPDSVARGRRLRFYRRLRDRSPAARPRERAHVKFRRKAQSDAVDDDGTVDDLDDRAGRQRGPLADGPFDSEDLPAEATSSGSTSARC